jgi:hypothetical protein
MVSNNKKYLHFMLLLKWLPEAKYKAGKQHYKIKSMQKLMQYNYIRMSAENS